MERWKVIPGFSKYEISNRGRIRNLITMRIKELNQPSQKYLKAILFTEEGERITIAIHRLVAITWIPNPDNKPEVNHRDGDKRNNRVRNLEWVTSKENTQHAEINGQRRDNRGPNNNTSKINLKLYNKIITFPKHLTNLEVCKLLKGRLSKSQIAKIRSGRSWKKFYNNTLA